MAHCPFGTTGRLIARVAAATGIAPRELEETRVEIFDEMVRVLFEK